MKKLLGLILAIIVCLSCAISTACSITSQSATYKFKSLSITANGQTTSVAVGEVYPFTNDEYIVEEDFITLEIKRGYIFTISISVNGEYSTIMGGKWEKKDGVLYLVPDGNASNPLEFSVKNKTLTLNTTEYERNIILVLEKK